MDWDNILEEKTKRETQGRRNGVKMLFSLDKRKRLQVLRFTVVPEMIVAR